MSRNERDDECSKDPEKAEGNGIQSPGGRTKKSRDIAFIMTVGRRKI